MFGFWSFLPLSTSDTIYYNGQNEDFILYIQQSNENPLNIKSIISIDLLIQKDNIFIL
jgi:hypothetical protein